MKTQAIVALAALAMIAGCGHSSRTLLPDIPLPPDMTAQAVEDPAAWTRLTPDNAVAIARAGGPFVGRRPVVRFLWLREGPRPFAGQATPVWIVVSDDLPPARIWGGDRVPGEGRPAVVVPVNVARTLTWAVVAADGKDLGAISAAAAGALPEP